jgi:signal transduction histidine kinase/CheY-like chemotaxis protein/HPt (histidine-containing phosphotransfer) domain-containing protein
MSQEELLKAQLEKAEAELSYLKRIISRMEKRSLRQEKLDDMNRHQTRWAMQQLERSRELAEQASQAKTDFLANMSHEIRTPLNIVLGMGELLAGTELGESQKQYLQSLRLSGEHLLRLINDILEFSRIESGTIEVLTTAFNIGELLNEVETMGNHLAREKGIDFSLNCDKLVGINRIGDARKTRQVLINLVGNAVKYTDSGRVSLTVESFEDKGEWLAFTVSDTGIGIPEDKQAQIFERFTQIEQGRLENKGGVGLGLAISKRLVVAMGGDIKIDSEVNRGSNFRVELKLPFTDRQPLEAQTGSDHRPSDTELPPLRVLVADDIYLNFEVIKNYLKDFPVTVCYAENGRQAQKAFLDDGYDIVLMDLRMPVMGGIEATAQIRKLETTLEATPTPIIAMTAHAFIEQENDYLKKGFDEVLIKPFSKHDLISRLKNYAPENVAGIEPNEGQQDQQAATSVSESLVALVPQVLDSIATEITTIKKALYEYDQDTIDKTSHAVKGLAGFYGFDRLSGLLEHLEDSVKKREFRTAYALADALGSHVNELRRKKVYQKKDLAN